MAAPNVYRSMCFYLSMTYQCNPNITSIHSHIRIKFHFPLVTSKLCLSYPLFPRAKFDIFFNSTSTKNIFITHINISFVQYWRVWSVWIISLGGDSCRRLLRFSEWIRNFLCIWFVSDSSYFYHFLTMAKLNSQNFRFRLYLYEASMHRIVNLSCWLWCETSKMWGSISAKKEW